MAHEVTSMRDKLKEALDKAEMNVSNFRHRSSQLEKQNVHSEDSMPGLFDEYNTKESIRNP